MKNVTLKFSDYIGAFKGAEQSLVSMDIMLAPFGLSFASKSDKSTLLGWVLDDLSTQFSENDQIDPIDVASSAFALGYDDAERFLKFAPQLICQAIRSSAAFSCDRL